MHEIYSVKQSRTCLAEGWGLTIRALLAGVRPGGARLSGDYNPHCRGMPKPRSFWALATSSNVAPARRRRRRTYGGRSWRLCWRVGVTAQAQTPLQLPGTHENLLSSFFQNRFRSGALCSVQPLACLQLLTPDLLHGVVPPLQSPAQPGSWPEVYDLLVASLC